MYGILTTTDSVTGATGLIWGLAGITAIYLVLGTITVMVLRRVAHQFRAGAEVPTPYGPMSGDGY